MQLKFLKKGSIGLLIGSCMALSCHKPPQSHLKKGFYYWKTAFKPTNYELKRLDSFHCNSLYVRFFDIDWNEKSNTPQPIAVSQIAKSRPTGYTYVPVIFITNEVMHKIQREQLELLVKNCTKLLYEKCLQSNIQPTEIQIDCDWTQSTKENYFYFLSFCHKQSFFKGKVLSSTIRLHQLRNPKSSGIPPVDKGLLMCYNMGNLKLSGDNNSILDLSVAKKYLVYVQDYPLTLDVAFPLFSWSLLFDDQHRFSGILSKITEEQLKNAALFNPLGNHLYQVKTDTTWQGYNLKRAATIRFESCSTQDLTKLASLISGRVPNCSTIIFYHLDSLTISKYSNDDLEKIYRTMH